MKLPQALTNNLGLKLASIVLALVLWAVVMGREAYEVEMRIPALPRSLPEGMELVEQSDPVVFVRLLGEPRVVRALQPNDIDLNLRLGEDLAEGETTVELPVERIRVPAGVRVLTVSPSRLRFRLERLIERQVAIRPHLIGRPRVGHRIGAVTPRPAEATLRGVPSVLDGLEAVMTEPIDVTGATGTFVQRVRLDPQMEHLYVVSPLAVVVRVEVVEEVIERTFSDVEIVCGPLPADVPLEARCTPARARVTIGGPYSLVQPLGPTMFQILAPAPRPPEMGDRDVALRVVGLSQPLKVIALEPDKVTMRLVTPEAATPAQPRGSTVREEDGD